MKGELTTIKGVDIRENMINIFFDSSEVIEAWIEDSDKYFPNVVCLNVDNKKKYIEIDYLKLCNLVKSFQGHVFKLSLCTVVRNKRYVVSNAVKDVRLGSVLVHLDKNNIFFTNVVGRDFSKISHYNNLKFININKLPIETLNIGTCFSRSLFKSEKYFNPMYKRYFNVKKTLFHNSFISIFSDEVKYDYSIIKDLNTGDAAKYVEIEFKKNIEEQFLNNNFQLIVVDNYIDATTPVIQYNGTSYLTYNKYFSESIFKRFFDSCEIIYPGTKKHLALYRNSIILFKKMLDKFNVKNVVLIGGRLCKYKIDEKDNETYVWNDKMSWILDSNENWDKVDEIFLNEVPRSMYIDKRNTNWKSDVYSPIVGGASPSHYQSGYYKDIFGNILHLLK